MEEEWELPKEVNRRSCSQASNTLLDLGETYRTHSTKEQSDKHTTHKCARWGTCTLCLVYGISKVVRFSDFTICHIQMCLVVHDPLSVRVHLCAPGLASRTVTVRVNQNTGQEQFWPRLSWRTCSPQSSSASTAERKPIL